MIRHVNSGEPLPRKLYDSILTTKNFQNGMATLRQIVFSTFDIHLHTDFDPKGAMSVLKLSRQINNRFHVVPQAELSRWPDTFSHIFTGGYAAGYYNYRWAEALSVDVYAVFEEASKLGGPVPDTETGARYCREVLAVGGSRPTIESFTTFHDRAPSIGALPHHGGMMAEAA